MWTKRVGVSILTLAVWRFLGLTLAARRQKDGTVGWLSPCLTFWDNRKDRKRLSSGCQCCVLTFSVAARVKLGSFLSKDQPVDFEDLPHQSVGFIALPPPVGTQPNTPTEEGAGDSSCLCSLSLCSSVLRKKSMFSCEGSFVLLSSCAKF